MVCIYIYIYLLCVLYISYIYIYIYIYIYYIYYCIYILYISAGFSLLGDRGNPPLAKTLLIHPAPGTISSPTKG